MIQIKEVEIENFRSIFKEKIELEFGDLTSIVGPNNSGKSNILRALQLFFTGMVEGKQYSSAHDFPLCEEVSAKDSTKIIVTVKYEPTKEHLLHNALLELQNTTTQKMLDDDLVKLRLSYSKNGVESWGFIGKSGNKNIQKDVIYKVRDALRQAIEFRYIPVGRNSLENITHEISSELIKTIFSGFSGAVKKRQDINTAINDLINKLSPSLSQSSLDVSQAVKQVFEEVQNVELHLPFSNLEEMIPNLSLVVSDTAKTGLQFKGAGIQTSTLLFLLKYLADKKPKHYNATQTSIWAIEEPESFLHPTKQKAISGLLKEFAKDVQTIITTHCAHFVPRDLERSSKVLVVDKLGDQFKSTQVVGTTYQEARQALGVSILDAMLLYPVNLIVEGISDEILIKGALSCLAQELGLNINDIKIFAANNALSATYLFETFSLNIEQNSDLPSF